MRRNLKKDALKKYVAYKGITLKNRVISYYGFEGHV